MSVTAEMSQDPIGPCGPLEQSEDSFRHSSMAAWSSSLDFGVHPEMGHRTGYTVAVMARVRIMIRLRVRQRVDNSTCPNGRLRITGRAFDSVQFVM